MCPESPRGSPKPLLGAACSCPAWGVQTCVWVQVAAYRDNKFGWRGTKTAKGTCISMLISRIWAKIKLAKKENVLKDRWLSREESAAVRRRTCQREVSFVTEGQPGQQTLMSFPPQQLRLHKLGWSPHSQLPFSPYEFCGHTVILRLGIWMSAWPTLCLFLIWE